MPLGPWESQTLPMIGMNGLNLVSLNYNFAHKYLMPNCYGMYRPKSSTRLFMFDDLIKFWFTIMSCDIK